LRKGVKIKGHLIFAPTLLVLFFVSGVALGAFGDVIEYYEIGEEDYNFYQPIALTYGDGYLWILEALPKKYGTDQLWLRFYKYEVVITDGKDLHLLRSFNISGYSGKDMNGFCYVTEDNKDYIWTTITTHKQLWQLDLSLSYTPIDYTSGSMIGKRRVLYLPAGYHPTAITLDNNLNIYFIDGITRKVYRINYSDYIGIKYGDVEEGDITELFEVAPLSASIPMGIEYITGIRGKFYITLAGEDDYIIKTNMNGTQLDSVELSDPNDPENTISYMPTDLTVDAQGYIWFTDDDWDILYKVEGSSQ